MADKKKKKGGGVGILKGLLLIVVLIVGGAVAYGFTLDTEYPYERSVVIDADKDDIHEYIGDLKKWDEWGPRRDEDPDMTYTYSESTTQPGDRMTFDTKDGTGWLEYTEVNPETGVTYKFQWESFKETTGGVKYEDTEDGKVKVTWWMKATETPFMERYFYSMAGDSMTDMFQKGLDKLKGKVEAN